MPNSDVSHTSPESPAHLNRSVEELCNEGRGGAQVEVVVTQNDYYVMHVTLVDRVRSLTRLFPKTCA